MGRNKTFPLPTETPVLCDPDRILALYNESDPAKPGKSISDTVRKWFIAEAAEKGWSGVKFMNHPGASKSAGCVLFLEPKATTGRRFIRIIVDVE